MKIEVQALHHPVAEKNGVQLYMARADLLHPLASGNKFYKLKPNIEIAKKLGVSKLLSFGGAFSNHIHAFAFTAKEHGFKSVGIIRGEQEYASNPTMQDVQSAGMQLEFVTREEYKRRNDVDYLAELQNKYPDALIIPEGGSSQLAIQGCAELAQEINATQISDVITVACGTGATFAGVVCGLCNGQTAIGYSALKDKTLTERVKNFIDNEGYLNHKYTIEQADFGGFAKLNKEVLDFVFEWLEQTGVLLDLIYTSKMCLQLMQQIAQGEFAKGTSITIVHSGGLQGWRGMKQKVVKLSNEASWQKIEAILTR